MIEHTGELLLSGIQHFAFCRRQWALIHIEQQWQENLRTVEGQLLHKHAHEAGAEKRGDIVTVCSLPVSSAELRVRGVCDVVEFHADENGVTLRGRYGREGVCYRPVPVEYKRGKPKENNADILQLCAQAMCLEEMLVCDIPKGYIFYGETRRRQAVQLDKILRSEVKETLDEMHMYYARGYTPKVKTGKFCNACSLRDVCLPKLCKTLSMPDYIDKMVKEADA